MTKYHSRPKLTLFLVLACSAFFVENARAESIKIGFTNSLNKVFQNPPYDFQGDMSNLAQIEMARNEYEAVQLVLFPQRDISHLVIEANDLFQKNKSTSISSNDIEINPIAYINLTSAEAQGSRLGYHPDPLLPNHEFQLTAEQPQPVLITIHTQKNTSPGTYFGQIKIKSNNTLLASIQLEVKVWDITLPETSRFKTFSMPQKDSMRYLWPQELGYVKPDQKEIERRYHKLAEKGFRNRLPPTAYLANGLISYNWKGKGDTYPGYLSHDRIGENQYQFNPTRYGEHVDFLLNHGANHFIIAITSDIYEYPEKAEQRKRALLDYLNDVIPYLKTRDLLNKTYIYNIDEPWGKSVEHAKKIYSLLKGRFGNDVHILQNTNQDNDKILNEFHEYFDAIDINLGFYQITQLADYRKIYPYKFTDVWWNLNLWPRSRPNLFLEYPLVDARIIGPMSYRFNIQGFEYWDLVSIKGVKNYQPLSGKELQIPWNVEKNSLDGLLLYPSTDIGFFSSLRFESFRDGLEDMELLYLLETLDPKNILLNVPIVRSISDYAQTANEIFTFREQIAAEITILKSTPN